MKITREEILHLAKLSNLQIKDQELVSLSNDLENIIDYISKLNQVDTEGVEPTYQVFELSNIWREDQVTSQPATPEQLISLSPTTVNQQIKVPKVL